MGTYENLSYNLVPSSEKQSSKNQKSHLKHSHNIEIFLPYLMFLFVQ